MVRTNCLRAVFLAACLVACASARRDQPRSAAAAWAETVKASVGPAWTNRVKQAAAEHDPGVCLDFRRDRRTVVNFTVDHDGQVSDVHVTASSGIEYLDNLAVDVFRSAKRLNPPPARAMGSQSKAEFPFAFTVVAMYPPDCAPRSDPPTE